MKNEKAEIISRIKRYGRVQALMKYVNIKTLTGAYKVLMKNDVTATIAVEYGENLNENFGNLLIRMKNRSYFPQSQDWLQRVDIDSHCKKYMFRAFEDRIVQYLFSEILEAIYKPKIQCSIADLEKIESIKKSRSKLKIYVARVEVDMKKLLSKFNQEYLINFLEQDIADRDFIRYSRRFLQSGTKLIDVCADSERDSTMSFLSMFCNVCVCFTLQILSTTQEWGLDGEMRVRRGDKSFWYLFDKVGDAQMIYRRLYRGLEEMGLDLSKDKICTLSTVFDNKKRYCKVGPSRRAIARAKNRRVKFGLTKELARETSEL